MTLTVLEKNDSRKKMLQKIDIILNNLLIMDSEKIRQEIIGLKKFIWQNTGFK